MSRLRYSRGEAEAEATRRAIEFVSTLSDSARWQHFKTHPDVFATKSNSSKHPVRWDVVFFPILPEGCIMDGGELFVTVDLESGYVGLREI